MGCHFLLQGIFLTQGSNPGVFHCRQILYHLSYQGSPYICKERFIFGIGAHDCGGGQVPSLPGGLETREELMVQLRSEGHLLAELPLPPRTLFCFVLFCFLLKPSPDWRRPTHTVRIIFSMDLNVNLILKIPSGQQPHV